MNLELTRQGFLNDPLSAIRIGFELLILHLISHIHLVGMSAVKGLKGDKIISYVVVIITKC